MPGASSFPPNRVEWMTEASLPLSSPRRRPPSVLSFPEHPDVSALACGDSATDIDAILATQRALRPGRPPRLGDSRGDDLGERLHALRTSTWPRTRSLAIDADGRGSQRTDTSSSAPGQETRVQSYLFGTVRPDLRGRGIGDATARLAGRPVRAAAGEFGQDPARLVDGPTPTSGNRGGDRPGGARRVRGRPLLHRQ